MEFKGDSLIRKDWIKNGRRGIGGTGKNLKNLTLKRNREVSQ